jgi:TRAP-type C4-dicarboxylate transport system permease small subunit
MSFGKALPAPKTPDSGSRRNDGLLREPIAKQARHRSIVRVIANNPRTLKCYVCRQMAHTSTPRTNRPAVAPIFAALDRALRAVTVCGMVLVLPVSLLLFLQWPLRDFGIGHSREANDLAQWLFAIYASIAVSYASRRHTHLAADALAHRYPARLRERLHRGAALCILLPSSLFVLYAGGGTVWQSLQRLDRFPDTTNPGYFLIVGSMWLLALLVLLQSLIDAFSNPRTDSA